MRYVWERHRRMAGIVALMLAFSVAVEACGMGRSAILTCASHRPR